MKDPIAFDFDGTITLINMYPICGEIRHGIDECIRMLSKEGYPIIIHTCRNTTTDGAARAFTAMIEYLKQHDIPYDAINANPNPHIMFNPTKPYACIYVEDRALGWNPKWDGNDIYNLIKSKLKEHPDAPITLHDK